MYIIVSNFFFFLRYMSQFKHSKRVNVKDVLACVKGHQLYAHAEACIKDRMPDMVDDEVMKSHR